MMPISKKPSNAQDFVNDFLRKAEKMRIDDLSPNSFLLNDNSASADKENYDVLIVCALPEERDRLFDAFSVAEEDRRKIIQSFRSDYNFIYQKFSYAGFNIAIVTQNAMGMATATSLTTRAILAMKPKIVAMTGICAGRKGKVQLGDIIVADQIFDYTAGKNILIALHHAPCLFQQMMTYATMYQLQYYKMIN